MNINNLLSVLVETQATDMFLAEWREAVFKVFGKYTKGSELGLNEVHMTANLLSEVAANMMSEKQFVEYEEVKEIDFAYDMEWQRFRVNAYHEKGKKAFVVRLLPKETRSFEELDLHPSYKNILQRKSGIIFVAGPTGSGKSTSLATMVEEINTQQRKHIITIEDPVEFVYTEKESIIEQREVGSDTNSFASALKSAMRQAPDVILVGEVRDLESIESAIRLAETGHLVLTTIHANSAPQCISKIIDVFPAEKQQQIRIQLSENLAGIFAQKLIRNIDGKSFSISSEILLNNPAVGNLIRENEIKQLNSVIQMAKSEGMILMEQSLLNLVLGEKISIETALSYANDKELLLSAIDG